MNFVSLEASPTNHKSMIKLVKVMKSLIMATKNYYISGTDIAKLLSISSNLYRLFYILLLHDAASYSSQGVLNVALQSNTLQLDQNRNFSENS
jgi:hypothetical protein